MSENKYPGISPKEVFVESQIAVDREVIRIKDILNRGLRSVSIPIGLGNRLKEIFETAGWKVEFRISGILDFACKEDGLKY